MKHIQPLLRLVILALIAYSFLTLLSVRAQLARARRELTEQQTAVETLRAETEALRADVEHAGEAESIERIAREQLGLVYPEEIITYSTGD